MVIGPIEGRFVTFWGVCSLGLEIKELDVTNGSEVQEYLMFQFSNTFTRDFFPSLSITLFLSLSSQLSMNYADSMQ